MIKNAIGMLTTLLIFLSLGAGIVWAGGFKVDSIGNVNTDGAQINHWWYTGTNVVFKGTAVPMATINTSVDGVTSTVTADSSGDWTFSPGDLGEGDKSIVFDSDGSTIKFTLTLGSNNVDWGAVGSGSATTLPATGVGGLTVGLLLGGMAVIAMGGKMVFDANKN